MSKKKKKKKMSLPVMRYGVGEFKNCFSIFSEAVKDRVLIFSGMTDLSFRVVNRGSAGRPSFQVVTGREKRNRNFQS
jgi:hypothetical protein